MPPQLDTLPTEVLFNILSFARPSYDVYHVSYPLNAIAATSRHLHTIVEEYARALAKRFCKSKSHKAESRKAAKTFSFRRKCMTELCQFCHTVSKENAWLYPTMVCCRSCDKEQFPKITMKNVHRIYHLSKLDLFTPNVLHPYLPFLPYAQAGCQVLMLEKDVLARRDHIYALLGDKAHDANYMQKRPAAHERITKHQGLRWAMDGDPTKFWEMGFAPNAKELARGPKTLQTKQSRKQFVISELEKEWAAMGMSDDSTMKEDGLRWMQNMGEPKVTDECTDALTFDEDGNKIYLKNYYSV